MTLPERGGELGDPVELPALGRRVEGQTILLAIVVYAWWGLTTWFWRDLPVWALVPLGAWVIAWQMNLQHEVIHGHPTPWRAVNEAIGVWPLSLWLPYSRYRETHLRHHQDANLTDPFEDPGKLLLDGRRDGAISARSGGRWSSPSRRCRPPASRVRPG